MKFEETHGG